MPEPLKWTLRIVGGGYCGAPHLCWLDDGEHPPPDEIIVGVCRAGQSCGTSLCRLDAAHVSFWLPDEEDAPTSGEVYEKADEYIQHGVPNEGVAEYVIGGLRDPQNFGERAREPVEVGYWERTAYKPAHERERVPA